MDEQGSEPAIQTHQVPTSVKDDNLNLINKNGTKAEIITELKKQLCLAGPLVVVSFLQFSLQMISLMFVGHLGQLPLAGASLATSFAGVTGFSLMLGMGGALETFCGQAYGAAQYHLLGVYMQRAMLIYTLLNIPVSVLWGFTGQIFTILKQDLQISAEAGLYSRWLIPSIFPYGILQCQLKFLQTQNNTIPMMISAGFTTLLHILVCWALIFRLGLGSKGAALSNAISYWTNVLILGMYIKFSSACEKTWKGFSKDGMKNLLTFLKLGVPSALMVCLEFWSYEILVLASGLLPNPKLETSMMSISLNTSAVVFRIPFGLGCAVSTRVSNELGAGRPNAARIAAQIAVLFAVIEGVLASSIAVGVRNIWGYLYTNDKQVVRYLASVMPILAISNFMDGMQGVLSGCSRGCGRQRVGALISLGAYYLVGLPSALILTFVLRFKGKGLWVGIIGGSVVQASLLLLVTVRMNWEHQANVAKNRVRKSSISHDLELPSQPQPVY